MTHFLVSCLKLKFPIKVVIKLHFDLNSNSFLKHKIIIYFSLNQNTRTDRRDHETSPRSAEDLK